MMKIKSSDVLQEFKENQILEQIKGEDIEVTGIASVDHCHQGDLVFAENETYIDQAIKNKAAVIVTREELAEKAQAAGITVLTTKNVNLAQALLKQRYADRNVHDSEWGKCHESAIIHSSADVAESAIVYPNVVIGAKAKIGPRTVIMSNSIIENDAEIGADCIIHPNVVIGYSCILGNRVIVQSGSVIGSEGYGYAQDENKKSHRIPQTGIVIIEDDVTIGSCNVMDRAAYQNTTIGSGTKFDNFCHVAHNVQIGKDCLLTAGFVVAGSTVIGDRVIASGQTGILDHLKIPDETIFVHRAGVTSSIKKTGIYAGIPAQPLDEYMKNVTAARKLAEMKKTLSSLTKEVEALKKQLEQK